MGVLTFIFGLLSFPSLFTLDQIRTMVARPELRDYPMVVDPILKLLDYYPHLVFGHIIFGGAMTWAGWMFLKRKDWARLTLSALNGFGIVFLIWSAWATVSYFNNLAVAMNFPEMVEAGLVEDIPGMVKNVVRICTILLLAPLIWMAWYFHSPKLLTYMEACN